MVALILWALLGAIALWDPRGNYWGGVEPPKAQVEAYDSARLRTLKTLDSSVYDEGKLNRLIREPQNTVSNVAYLWVGLAVFFAARRRSSKSFGIACIFLGVGSGLYHASLLSEWRMLDILGVYAALFSLLVIGIYAVTRSARFELLACCACWVAAFLAGIHRNEIRITHFKVLDSKVVVVGCVACGSLMVLWMFAHTSDRRRYYRLASLLLITAVAAFFGGLEDRFGGLWALPGAFIQGHAVWHCLGAFALLFAYEIFSLGGYDRSVFAATMAPNQSLEPTGLAVTPSAGAEVAPAKPVAHH